VNGAMSARALWAWLAVLTVASTLLLVTTSARTSGASRSSPPASSSVVYNLNSKYLETLGREVRRADVIVAGPFFFYYAGLVAAPGGRRPGRRRHPIGSPSCAGCTATSSSRQRTWPTARRRERCRCCWARRRGGGRSAPRPARATCCCHHADGLLCGWAVCGHWSRWAFAVWLGITVRFCSGPPPSGATERCREAVELGVVLLSLYTGCQPARAGGFVVLGG
jgi:hypothetical protein